MKIDCKSTSYFRSDNDRDQHGTGSSNPVPAFVFDRVWIPPGFSAARLGRQTVHAVVVPTLLWHLASHGTGARLA